MPEEMQDVFEQDVFDVVAPARAARAAYKYVARKASEGDLASARIAAMAALCQVFDINKALDLGFALVDETRPAGWYALYRIKYDHPDDPHDEARLPVVAWRTDNVDEQFYGEASDLPLGLAAVVIDDGHLILAHYLDYDGCRGKPGWALQGVFHQVHNPEPRYEPEPEPPVPASA